MRNIGTAVKLVQITHLIKKYEKAILADSENKIELSSEILSQDRKFLNLNKGLYNLFVHKDYIKAIKYFDKIIIHYPELKILYFYRAKAYKQLNDYNHAISSLDQIIKLDANCKQAHINKANNLRLLDKPYEALAACEKAINIDKNYKYAYLTKGIILFELKQYDEASLALDNYLGIDPDKIDIWQIKKKIAKILGKLDDIDLCEEVIPVLAELKESSNYNKKAFSKFVQKIDNLPKTNPARELAINSLAESGNCWQEMVSRYKTRYSYNIAK